MKHALIKNNLILLFTAIGLFFLIAIVTLYRLNQKSEDALMHRIMDEVVTVYDYRDDLNTLLIYYQENDERRVTITDNNLVVLLDTHDPSTIGLVKSNRPEFDKLDTIQRRYSETVGYDMLYLVAQMDDGRFIRVAVESQIQTSSYRQAMTIMVITGFIILGLSYVGLIKVNQHLLKPWHKMYDSMMNLSEGKYQMMSLDSPYHEINEILYYTNDLSLKISNQIYQLESYKKQLNQMLDEIKQGVMLFDYQKRMIYYNEDAKHIFHLEDQNMYQESYQFIRNVNMQAAIDQVSASGGHQSLDVVFGSQTFVVDVFQISESDHELEIAHVMVTIKDVTLQRQLEQTKKDFFSHVSHELKSPVTAIQGFAELIYLDMVKDIQVKEVAKNIMAQSKHMDALVEDMLMLSRLENLKEVPSQALNLEDILKETLNLLTPVLKEKSMDITVKSSPVNMVCDRLDMHKLFKNLIENAIKYSEPKKQISIELSQHKKHIDFHIKDQGFGIDSSHQNRVFERFYRIDKGRSDGGTGLGLAIVKHIVIKYHGKIQLKSKVNEGTHIHIQFDQA
ncbi:MAG: sensor histidine kinase [Acholeplasmataceae bacterium]